MINENKVNPDKQGWCYTLDLETSSTDKSNGMILTIGVVYGNIFTGKITDTFYCRVDPRSMPNRIWCEDTKRFWEMVNEKYPASYTEVTSSDLPRIGILNAITQLMYWIRNTARTKEVNVFGKGPEFDNEFIDVFCRELDIRLPWRFRCNQSHRTIEWLTTEVMGGYPPIDFDSVTHHALTDATDEFYNSHRDLQLILKSDNLPSLEPRNLNVKNFEPDYEKYDFDIIGDKLID